MFYLLDCTLKYFPIFQPLGLSILLQTFMAIFVLPSFVVFSDVHNFGMFKPNSFHITGKSLDDIFKVIFAMNVACIKTFDDLN